MFQSTPANFTAGDRRSGPRRPAGRMFQSTPANFTAGDGRAHRHPAGVRPDVSIHARQFHSGRRHRGPVLGWHGQFQSTPANFTAGDWRRRSRICRCLMFQSTPANFTAGDSKQLFNPASEIEFQSTPANFTAGDRLTRLEAALQRVVSIHARQFHSGRPSSPLAPTRSKRSFNPRPPISQRATLEQAQQRLTTATFQSTPANFTAGDGRRRQQHRRRPAVSIHARQFHSGRHVVDGRGQGFEGVSIHARQFHSGRHCVMGFIPAGMSFQSTPANFTAGDTRCPG